MTRVGSGYKRFSTGTDFRCCRAREEFLTAWVPEGTRYLKAGNLKKLMGKECEVALFATF